MTKIANKFNTLRLNQDYDVDLNRLTYEVLNIVKEEDENAYNEILKYSFEELYKEKIDNNLSKDISINDIISSLIEKGIIQNWESDMIPMDSKIYDNLLNNIEKDLNNKDIDFYELDYQRNEENQNDEELIELVTKWYLRVITENLMENKRNSAYLK